MSFSKDDFSKQEQQLMKRAAEIQALVIDNDPGSFEEYRDGFRFMARLSVYSFLLSFLIGIVSVYFVITRDSGNTYLTTRDGRLLRVYPIASSEEAMISMKNQWNKTPEKMIELRDIYNKNTKEDK